MTRKQRALENAFWKANRYDESVNVYEVIDSYRTLVNATDCEKDAMYNYICERLGFGKNLLTEQQLILLEGSSYLPKPLFS